MARKLSKAQATKDIKSIMDKYPRQMREKKVKALIDITLWGVAAKEGPDVANQLITRFELNRPALGSHEWFDSDETLPHVIHLDPNFKVPDEDKIFPTDKRHPGDIKLNTRKNKMGR